MAKRFTDTDIWDKEWFMKLNLKEKLLIKFIFDKCDVAGIWSPNWSLATIYIGEKVSLADTKSFEKRIEILPDNKIFVLDFIEFQYGSLSEACKPHVKIFEILRKYNLLSKIIKGYPKGIQRVQEEEKEEELETKTDLEVGGMGEGEKEPPKVVPIHPPPFHKKYIVKEIVSSFKKSYPNDPSDSRDNESALMMAVKVTDYLKFPKNSFESEKTTEVLDYCQKIIKFSVGKPFFGNLPLYRMAHETPGLIKKYENSLNGTATTTTVNGTKINPKDAGADFLSQRGAEKLANYQRRNGNVGT